MRIIKVANIFILNDANIAQMKYASSFYISGQPLSLERSVLGFYFDT